MWQVQGKREFWIGRVGDREKVRKKLKMDGQGEALCALWSPLDWILRAKHDGTRKMGLGKPVIQLCLQHCVH